MVHNDEDLGTPSTTHRSTSIDEDLSLIAGEEARAWGKISSLDSQFSYITDDDYDDACDDDCDACETTGMHQHQQASHFLRPRIAAPLFPQGDIYPDLVEIHLDANRQQHQQVAPSPQARWVRDLDDEEEYAQICELNKRKQQLVRFYSQHQPTKIPEVHALLTNYRFDDVKASLLKKYNGLPEGWEPPRSSKLSLCGMQAELAQFVHAICTGNITIED